MRNDVMKHNISRILVVLSVLLAGLPTALAAGGISLEPNIIRLTMRPGETWRGTVYVTNESGHAVSLEQTSVNVSRTTEGDTIEISEDLASRLGTLASWLSTDSGPLSEAPGQRSELTFSIHVPENAPPGVHRALLLLTPKSPTQEANALTTTAGVGLGVELTVVGQTSHHVRLGNVSVAPRIGTKPPVAVTGAVTNTGNTLPSVMVRAEIGRPWGPGVSVVLDPDNGSRKVAPGMQTLFRGAWNGRGFVPAGIFKTRIIAQDSSGTYEATRYFILVPWQAILGVLIAAVVVFAGRRYGPRFLHRRRR